MCAYITLILNGFAHKRYERTQARTYANITPNCANWTNKCRWCFCGPNQRINFNIYNWLRTLFRCGIYIYQTKPMKAKMFNLFFLPLIAFGLNRKITNTSSSANAWVGMWLCVYARIKYLYEIQHSYTMLVMAVKYVTLCKCSRKKLFAELNVTIFSSPFVICILCVPTFYCLLCRSDEKKTGFHVLCVHCDWD